MARNAAEIARIAAARAAAVTTTPARRHAPRTFQSTNMSPTPSWAWLNAWMNAHVDLYGQPTYAARDSAIEQWGLGATSRSAAAFTAREQELLTKLTIERSIADALCAARTASMAVSL